MNDLIEVKNGVAILRADIASQIAEFERVVKSIEEQEKALKSMILEEMEEKGILWIDTDELRISYVAPSDRERFDTKTFKEENPLIYDEYVTMSHVRSSVRIKPKEKKDE
jgi:predicted phage-related endonuclease